MKAELDAALCKKYPLLYSDRNQPANQTCMCWGFECGDGWYDLLDRLSAKLEPLIQKWVIENPNTDLDYMPRASQVKEKFGSLRFYMTTSTDEMESHIRQAEEESFETCEECGAPATINKEGWIRVLCKKHKEERDNRPVWEP